MLVLLSLLMAGCCLPTGGSSDDGGERPSLELTPTMGSGPNAPNFMPGNMSGPDVPESKVMEDQCEDLKDGGPVSGPGCLSGVIKCGDTIVGHTKGGGNDFNTRFYEANFCTPATTNHNGGDERVYRLDLPAGEQSAWVTLHTPCANLDLAVMKHNSTECPTADSQLSTCDMWPSDGNQSERVSVVSQSKKPVSYFIVVEGRDEEEGAFSLSVQCEEGLH